MYQLTHQTVTSANVHTWLQRETDYTNDFCQLQGLTTSEGKMAKVDVLAIVLLT